MVVTVASEDTGCTCQKAPEGHLGWDKSMIDPHCPLHGHEAPEKQPDPQIEAVADAVLAVVGSSPVGEERNEQCPCGSGRPIGDCEGEYEGAQDEF
jgi:hypothetical protein